MMLVVAYVVMVVMATTTTGTASTIGMNWGRNSAQRLVPSMAVDLLLQNGIQAARIFTTQEDILKAFAGSGISLTTTIYSYMLINSSQAATKWVNTRKPYFDKSNIRNIVIGDSFVFKLGDLNAAINALEFVQQDINAQGFGDQIKLSMSCDTTLFKTNPAKPSEAEFKEEIKEQIDRILHNYKANNAPFFVEIMPLSYVTENNMDLNFAFMDNGSTITDTNGLVYTNVVEFLYDSFVWALKKADASNLEIVIGLIGWPTDGYPNANASSAERFYKSFLPWLASDKGTPMRPGPLTVYIQSLVDENKTPANYPSSRHLGVYTTYGVPKYKIDLMGKGRNIYPTTAKGVMQMPKRWCIFNNMTQNRIMIKYYMDVACQKADCTTLAPGGSCSHLTYEQNVSYAFNMHFQSTFQEEDSCVMGGLAMVVTKNPSTGECIFPVEVVRGQQDVQ